MQGEEWGDRKKGNVLVVSLALWALTTNLPPAPKQQQSFLFTTRLPIGEPYVPEPPAVDKENNNANQTGSRQWEGLTGEEPKQPNTFQPIWMPTERNYHSIDTRGNAALPGNPLARNPNLGAAVKRHTI
jgi:hypothetical protein